MKKLMFLGMVAAAAGVFANPVVGNVSFSYSEATGKAEVSYDLSGGTGIVTFDVLTNGVSIGGANFVGAWGDVWKEVGAGAGRKFWWRPQATQGAKLYTQAADGTFEVRVKASPLSDPPLYLVASLASPSNVYFYTEEALLPGGKGVQNDIYRNTWMVMRRIPAAGVTWRMGCRHGGTSRTRDDTHAVTLSRDYYMAVYQFTHEQATHFSNADRNSMYDNRPYKPISAFSYQALRANQTFLSWPEDKHAVDSTKIIGLMRAQTGLEIDLPTDAQWEYACRAGTGSEFNNGSDDQTVAKNDLAWCQENETTHPYHKDDGGITSQKVGLKQPNAWGLYDMHGNAWDIVLDWYQEHVGWCDLLDPVGPSFAQKDGNYVVDHGGTSDNKLMNYCTANHRNGFGYNSSGATSHLVCPIVIPDFVGGGE